MGKLPLNRTNPNMNPLHFASACLTALVLAASPALAQNTHIVQVAPNGSLTFEPQDLHINIGDTIQWEWNGFQSHNVNSDDGAFLSGVPTMAPNTFAVTFDSIFLAANPVAGDLYAYHCDPHQIFGMVGSIHVMSPRTLSAPLAAGQSSAITVDGANPGNTIMIGYSLVGAGPLPVNFGSLALSPPINQLPPRTADALGHISIPVTIPGGLAGTTVFLHAAELLGGGTGILTNPVSVTL